MNPINQKDLNDACLALQKSFSEAALIAAEHMDWMQVVLNQSAPCFWIEGDGSFCGRAEHWTGHLDANPHGFLSLTQMLKVISPSNAPICDGCGAGPMLDRGGFYDCFACGHNREKNTTTHGVPQAEPPKEDR